MTDKCKVCKVFCDISKSDESRACAFEHNGDKNICPFDARYLDLSEHDKQIRAEVIDEIKQKLKSTGGEITFNLPVEEILGDGIDLDDFAMLVQDAVQVYRKMVLGVLEQLKEQKK